MLALFCCCFLSLTCRFFNAASSCKSSQWGSSLLWKPQLRAHVWWGSIFHLPWQREKQIPAGSPLLNPCPLMSEGQPSAGFSCHLGGFSAHLAVLDVSHSIFSLVFVQGPRGCWWDRAPITGWAGRDGFWGGGERQCQQFGGNFLISKRAESCQDTSAPGLEVVMLWECSTGRIQGSVLTMKLPTLGPILWNFNSSMVEETKVIMSWTWWRWAAQKWYCKWNWRVGSVTPC